jgi:hypothetical protein
MHDFGLETALLVHNLLVYWKSVKIIQNIFINVLNLSGLNIRLFLIDRLLPHTTGGGLVFGSLQGQADDLGGINMVRVLRHLISNTALDTIRHTTRSSKPSLRRNHRHLCSHIYAAPPRQKQRALHGARLGTMYKSAIQHSVAFENRAKSGGKQFVGQGLDHGLRAN